MSQLFRKESQLIDGREVVLLTIDEYKQVVTMVNNAQDAIAKSEEEILEWKARSERAAENAEKLRWQMNRMTGGAGGDYVQPVPRQRTIQDLPPVHSHAPDPPPIPRAPVEPMAPTPRGQTLDEKLAGEGGKSVRKDLEAGRPAVPIMDPDTIAQMEEIVRQYRAGQTEEGDV